MDFRLAIERDDKGWSPNSTPTIDGVTMDTNGLAWLEHEASEIERMKWAFERTQVTTIPMLQQRLKHSGVPAELVSKFGNFIYLWSEQATERLPALVINLALARTREPHEFPLALMEPGVGNLPRSPRFPSGMIEVDMMLNGGLYGVAAVTGPPKAGKSFFALRTAVTAARAGWKVVYINAEMTRSQITNRLLGICGGFIPIDLREQMIFWTANRGTTASALVAAVQHNLSLDVEKLLIIEDSVHTLAALIASEGGGGGFFGALSNLGYVAMESRRASEGKVSWLLVAEQNKSGDLKGLGLQYTSDVVLRMRLKPTSDLVNFDIPFSRETRSGIVGEFQRDWVTGSFISANAKPSEPKSIDGTAESDKGPLL